MTPRVEALLERLRGYGELADLAAFVWSERDRLMREAVAAGARPSDVARAAGVSRQRVHQITGGTTE